MIRFTVLFFVIQIYYCSALDDCKCEGIVLPIYAVCLIGILTSILLVTTVVLAVKVLKSKQEKRSELTIFGNNRQVSINKYQRQGSGGSQRSFKRHSNNDERVQLSLNEVRGMYDEDDDDLTCDDIDAVKIHEENEAKSNDPPQKIARHKQPKFPIFPQMEKEQMDELCKAVLSKHRLKESTSLSDLDKIVNDAKAEREQSRYLDISASTPVLDVSDGSPSTSSITKLSDLESNLQESKLEDVKENINNSKNGLKDKDCETKSESSQNNTIPKLKQSEIIAKLVYDEMNAKRDENNSKSNQAKSNQDKMTFDDTNGKTAESTNELIQEDLYDCPPPRTQNDVFNYPPSPKFSNELYDFPPISKVNNELYDFPPIHKLNNDVTAEHRPQSQLYDFPPSPRPHNDTYECPPTNKNIIISDDDASGYLFPITDSVDESSTEPQYTNAKSMTNISML